MKTKEELRLYFENGDKPTQEHFWAWLESYWHKDEKIDMTRISGLENGLPKMNDFYAEIDENGDATLAHLSVRNIFIKPGTLHIPAQFASNIGLSNVFLTDSLLTIGENAFSNNLIKTLTIPGNITEIKASAFATNRLTSLQIAPGVLKIGHEAFRYNTELTSVTLGSNTQYYADSFEPTTLVAGGIILD